uniref:BCL10 immune signaling adaptor n=2 Tax=Cyprinidae TaxID=7953 RepID=A0A8C1SD65_CYPCA
MAGLELLSDQGYRLDGRKASELRKVQARMSVFAQADGSAYLEQGNTKALAVVYGPHETRGSRSKSLHDRAVINCQFSMATFSTAERKRRPHGDRKSSEMSLHLKQTFEAAVLTELYPRSQIDIYVKAIDRLRPYLVDKIIAERHFDYLRSKKILTREDTEEISCRTTRGRRTSKLLDILAENPRGLDMLIESIKWGRTLNFIIAKITDEVQRVKNERLEALKAGSSANSGYSITKGATNDFSKMDSDYDKYSTICYHPEGEGSQSSSVATGSFNLRYGSGRVNEALSVCEGTGSMNVPSNISSSLPKPGDPGAPALPEELDIDVQDLDAAVCGSTGSSGDANFQPLRSRSLSPHIS